MTAVHQACIPSKHLFRDGGGYWAWAKKLGRAEIGLSAADSPPSERVLQTSKVCIIQSICVLKNVFFCCCEGTVNFLLVQLFPIYVAYYVPALSSVTDASQPDLSNVYSCKHG